MLGCKRFKLNILRLLPCPVVTHAKKQSKSGYPAYQIVAWGTQVLFVGVMASHIIYIQ